jgi:TolB protein
MTKATTTRTLAAAICAGLALATLAVCRSAYATYPGATNGRLAFGVISDGGNSDIYSVRPNGGALRRLTDDPGFDACPAYSADGRFIAWCHGTPPTNSVWVMKQNGTSKTQLTNFGAFPDFSPDGERVALQGRPPGSASIDIYVVDRDGTGLTRLTSAPGTEAYPAWSPDGTTIAFLSDRTGIPQVWLMHADGTEQRQLTFDSTWKDQVPDWRPDGSQLAYVADTAPDSGGDIWVIDSDGSDPRPLTAGSTLVGTAWSPDGTQLATTDTATGTVEVLNADGTGLRAVHSFGLRQLVPAWQPRGTGLVRHR